MINLIYIIICLFIIGFNYYRIKIIGFDINKKKSKKHYKSENNTIKDKIVSKNELNSDYKRSNLIKYIYAPTNLSISNLYKYKIPDNIIRIFKIKCNNQNILNKILISFYNTKFIFNKLFINEEGFEIINNNNTFINLYKTIISKKIIGYNICLKFFNSNDILFIYMKNYKLIKIKNNKNLKLILENIQKNKIFILKKKNNYLLSYGKFLTINNNDDIINLFFKKNLINNNIKDNQNYEIISKFDYITIFYWISSPID